MTIPTKVQELVDRALAVVQQDADHQLPPFLRRLLYDAFCSSPDNTRGECALEWLEILTVRFVLPRWLEDPIWYSWDHYPKPKQLVEIREDRLRGVLKSLYFTHYESLAAEMVSTTSEDRRSPQYPIWCIFEAAVRLFFRSSFNPTEKLTDHELKDNPCAIEDIAHLVLIAYAGRIQTAIVEPEKLKLIWEHWYYETEQDTPLPWKLTLNSNACLYFWKWWLLEAIPRSWQLADQQLLIRDDADILQLEKGVLYIGDVDEILHEDDDTITILCGPGETHEETLTGEDARRLNEWLDRDYERYLQYHVTKGLTISDRVRPKNKL